MKLSVFLMILFAVAAILGPAEPEQCSLDAGQHVTLTSILDDPRVLLWRSKEKLEEYLQGRWGGYEVLTSTSILQPGTTAIVTFACPSGDTKIAGVRVLAGVHKGAIGFVDAHDVHP